MKSKKFLQAIFAICLVASMALLVSCGTTAPDNGTDDTTDAQEGGKLTYTVKVTDHAGNVPSSDVLIEVYKDLESVGMKRTDANGEVSFELERGDYTFVPTPSEGEFHYDETLCVLSEAEPTATVMLYNLPTGTQTVYPPDSGEGYSAARIGEGATYVEIDRPEMSYYIFTPTRGGIYKIGYISESALTIGYYGNPNFIMTESITEVKDRAFEIEIPSSSIGDDGGGTAQFVIGIRSLKERDCVITIERIGDPPKVLEWEEIAAAKLPEKLKTDYLNHTLIDFDVTDKNATVVYSESDGFYHYGTEDGPIVFVRISSASPYIASFTKICETTRMYKYFYDDEGNMTKKESYNSIINQYAKICDSQGVCPLTEEIANVIKNTGDQFGWWDFSDGGNNIFATFEGAEDEESAGTGITAETINLENAWLFACCYVDEFVFGAADKPINLTTSEDVEYSVIFPEGETINFRAIRKAVLTIENANGLTVTFDGQTYTADEDGLLKVIMEMPDGATDYRFTVAYGDAVQSGKEVEFVFTFTDYIPE